MKFRFRYPFFKIKEAFDNLFYYAEQEPCLFDQDALEDLSCILVENKYAPSDNQYRTMVLQYMANIVTI